MFRISLDALLVLDAVDRLGSFAAAGGALFKVPSTISYTISKLEQDLGVQIYERQGPKVSLTKVGLELLTEGRHLIRAAEELEQRVKRVASGWETELSIGMDTMFSTRTLATDIQAFCSMAGTRIKLVQESLSGTWEALLEGRVDILIGAAGEGPSGGGYAREVLGMTEFVFCVAPAHPLAAVEKPLGKNDLAPYRAVVVSDSVRRLAPRTVGLLLGQDTLSVPTMRAKLDYQIAGLGFGFLPVPLAQQAIAQGLLMAKEVQEPRPPEPVCLAWRTAEAGEGLKWWIARIKGAPDIVDRLWVDSLNPAYPPSVLGVSG